VCLAYEEDADCDLPAEAMHHTKPMLIDTLGCAMGGYASEPSPMAWAPGCYRIQPTAGNRAGL